MRAIVFSFLFTAILFMGSSCDNRREKLEALEDRIEALEGQTSSSSTSTTQSNTGTVSTVTQ